MHSETKRNHNSRDEDLDPKVEARARAYSMEEIEIDSKTASFGVRDMSKPYRGYEPDVVGSASSAMTPPEDLEQGAAMYPKSESETQMGGSGGSYDDWSPTRDVSIVITFIRVLLLPWIVMMHFSLVPGLPVSGLGFDFKKSSNTSVAGPMAGIGCAVLFLLTCVLRLAGTHPIVRERQSNFSEFCQPLVDKLISAVCMVLLVEKFSAWHSVQSIAWLLSGTGITVAGVLILTRDMVAMALREYRMLLHTGEYINLLKGGSSSATAPSKSYFAVLKILFLAIAFLCLFAVDLSKVESSDKENKVDTDIKLIELQMKSRDENHFLLWLGCGFLYAAVVLGWLSILQKMCRLSL